MPKFYTRRADVPLAPGQTLGYRKRKGYYAREAPLPYPGYMGPAAQERSAAEAARAALLPAQQEIARERAELERRARERQQNITGYSQAAAQMLQSIGPQTAGIYNQAADAQGTFGKGFSDGLRMALGQGEQQGNELLAKQGSPQQMPGTAAPAADVLYGLGGYIPASTFSREGAAFGAAASQLPATALGRGQQMLGSSLAEAEQEQKALDQALLDLKARYPDIYQKALQALRSEQQQARAASVSEQYLLNTMRSTGANISGVDPLTGMPTYDAVSDAAEAAADASKARAAQQAKRSATRTKAVGNRSQALTEARRTVIELASGMRGKPLESGKSYLGRYVKKGGGFTNNIAEAEFEGRATWRQAYNQAWASIADDLKARYGIKDSEIRRLIRSRLLALGFKPPAKRKRVSPGLKKYPR